MYRYQNALLDDEDLRQRLEGLRPDRRRTVPIAVACVCAIPLFLARFENSIFRYVLIGAGCLAPLISGAQFVREYTIVRNWAAAVGTVIWFQKLRNRRGNSAAIKYLFRGADGLLHLGKTVGSMRLVMNRKTLGIIYCRDNPSRSMILSQFWFYYFSPAATREGIEPSKVVQGLKADS